MSDSAPHSFRFTRKGAGRRIMELAELTFLGRVQHVDHVEVLLVPTIRADGNNPRLLLIGALKGGETVVIETTVELFRRVCREVGDEH